MKKNIAFEGLDGSGKTTQINIQYSRLCDMGIPVSIYRYTEKNNIWGRLIKKAYSLEEDKKIHPLAEFRWIQETLYALSARANLNLCKTKDQILLSDRSVVTAYASHKNKIPEWYISLLEPNITPETVIYLDINPKIGIERIKEREVKLRDENLESLIELRCLYFNVMFENRPKRFKNTEFVVVDAAKPLKEVTSEISKIIDKLVI